MSPNTMRRIDRWVGVPLCFLLSPFCWISDTIRGAKRKKADIRRTLFIELSEMGSAILVDPAMKKLQANGAGLYFAIFSKNYKSLEILNTIPAENVFRMNAKNFGTLLLEIFRFLAWCRRKRISTVIDLELFSRFTALLSFFSGARSRVGFTNFHDEGCYRGNLTNKPVRYNPHVHIAVNFISLVNRALDLFHTPYSIVPVGSEELRLGRATVSEQQKNVVREKIRQLYPPWNGEQVLLFNVNASDLLPQRRWQKENFTRVARELLQRFPNAIVVATGAPAEREYVQDFVSMVGNERCVNSAGFFEFSELVPLYSISRLMITNDSGPAHFASVTELKVFVLFGPETPHLYLPLGGNAEPIYRNMPCSPCVSAANHRKTTCIPRPCITGIEPEPVLQKLEIFLRQSL
ncbi:MAG TPA: glycosyltransferase family 9 protein [Chitinophagaceae bacterium]|nr:glycosyltransferase family 9 protein [Chitinophagaceae bacterium]